MDNFGTSRTVHTILWDEIRNEINQIFIDTHIDYIQNKDMYKDKFNKCVDSVKEWLSPIIDLKNFEHVYHEPVFMTRFYQSATTPVTTSVPSQSGLLP